eukprot:8188935-Pyramimonas_sp.AAC.1
MAQDCSGWRQETPETGQRGPRRPKRAPRRSKARLQERLGGASDAPRGQGHLCACLKDSSEET